MPQGVLIGGISAFSAFLIYLISLGLCVKSTFPVKSTGPMGTKLGKNLCYDEGQLYKRDGVRFMHN